MKRLTHLDWLRGLAVLIMILWHTMDSWTASSARHNATFDFITMAGGWAAPLFLFLAGVSLALAGQKLSGEKPIAASASALINARGAPPPRAAAPRLADSLGSAAAGAVGHHGAPPPLARAPALEDSLRPPQRGCRVGDPGASRGAAGAAVAGAPPRAATNIADASWRLQKRGWQIFLLAHLFRFQAFLLNPGASWESLLKPDILNILGLGMVATAWCWGRATSPASAFGFGEARRSGMSRRRRMRQVLWLLGPATAIVLLAPGSRVWEWPALFRAFAPRLEAYIRPVSGMGVFSVFPWVAFVFVGAFAGAHIASRRDEHVQRRLQLELMAAGVLAGAAGLAGRHLPALSSQSSFWTTSISFFLIRAGAMTVLIPAAWLWMQRPTLWRLDGSRSAAAGWSPLVLFGRTSLFVYWVHVELAYGIASYPLHGALSLRAALLAYVIFTAFMLGLAGLWSKRTRSTSNSQLATHN